MQTKLPFFGSEKREKNNAPSNTPITKERLKSVWNYLHNINNKDKKMGFEAQYGKLPGKISQITKDQALDLNKYANMLEGENVIAKLATGETEFLTNVEPAAFDDIKSDPKVKSAKTTGNKPIKELLLKRYLELREDAFLMDYIDRYKDEVNEGGIHMCYKSNDILDQSYKADFIAENKELEEEPNEISYDDAKEKGLKNPDKADISKDKDISDYELKRGMAIQKAMDKDNKEVDENMEFHQKQNVMDDEGRHAKHQLKKAAEYSIKLSQMLGDMDQLPAWVQEKIIKASDYMSTVYHYLDYEMSRSEDNLKQNMDNYIMEVKKKLKEAPEDDELGPPTIKHPTPSMLAVTLKRLGLNGNTIDSVKVVQTNLPTYKVNLINGEAFYLSHNDRNDPFKADIGNKYYDMNDLIGGVNQAKDAINNLLTKDQFQGLGGDAEGGGGEEDLGAPPADEPPPAEEPEA